MHRADKVIGGRPASSPLRLPWTLVLGKKGDFSSAQWTVGNVGRRAKFAADHTVGRPAEHVDNLSRSCVHSPFYLVGQMLAFYGYEFVK